MLAAAGFVRFLRADEDDGIGVRRRTPVHEALRAAGRGAADHADGLEFVHRLSQGHDARHRTEGLAAKIHVKPRHDDADAASGKRLGDVGDPPVEELGLVDGRDRNAFRQVVEDVGAPAHRHGFHPRSVMRGDLAAVVPGVEHRLEYRNPLARDLRPTHAADELLALPAEHAATDHLDPSPRVVHPRLPYRLPPARLPAAARRPASQPRTEGQSSQPTASSSGAATTA